MHDIKLKIYITYDKISGFISNMNVCTSAGDACRKAISQIPALRFDDYILYEAGEYIMHAPDIDYSKETVESLKLGSDVHVCFYDCGDWKPIIWTSWRMPESQAELLAPLGLSKEETEAIVLQKQKEITSNIAR